MLPTTSVRLLPLLLCCAFGSADAAGLPPLRVAPDLLRPSLRSSAQALPAPEAAPAAERADAARAEAGKEPPTTGRGKASALKPEAAAPRSEGPAVSAAPAAESALVEAVRAQPSPQPAEQIEGEADTAALTSLSATSVSKPSLPAGATAVKALRILGTRTVELVAEGEAELQRDDLLLTADRVSYREPSDEVVAEGNVVLRQGEDTVSGPRASLVVGDSTGSFEAPSYYISRQRQPNLIGEEVRTVSGSGQAESLQLEGENQYRFKQATWSTCQARDPDWYLKAGELKLDYDREIGTARDASIVFKDVPIFWLPWAEFPLSGQRQSGLLPPTFGSSNKTGLDLSLPYYFNLAPNYDATLAPRLMSRRGIQLGGEFRYLGEHYRGEARAEWMPSDRVYGEARTLASVQHEHRLSPALYAALDLNSVSDDNYFEDLSSRIGVASRINLLRQGYLRYQAADWWRAELRMQSYQTLNPDREERNLSPYRRLPQLLVSGERADLPWGLKAALSTEYVRFGHEDRKRDKDEGRRFVAYPQLSLPLAGASWFLTPKAGFHYSRYELDRAPQSAPGRTSITRSVPVLSLDSGLFFDREANFFGRDYQQTLEPRLFYLRVPSRAQGDIPNFDSSRLDVGFAQMFAENRFAGSDRIGDANDLTAAVTTRFIDSKTGLERLRAMVGQRYYFSDEKVFLFNRDELRDAGRGAETLFGLGGQLSRTLSVNTYLQYNTETSRTERANASLRYQPGFAKVFNLSYRYAPNLRIAENLIGLEDIDVSAQWPLARNWYGVGRVTHSLLENRVTEAIGGLEYNGGCWVFRVAVHRFALERDDASKAIYVQLELNDLAGIGSNPLSLLTRSVPGYGKINDSTADRIFGTP